MMPATKHTLPVKNTINGHHLLSTIDSMLRRVMLVLVPAFLAAPVLGAQLPGGTAKRDSTHDDSLAARRAQGLPRVVVTGTLVPSPSVPIAVARDVIDRTALQAEPSRAAVDALRHATGVHIDEANGPLGPTIIRLRGSEEQFTQILVDGVSVNENGGYFDWHGLSLVNVRAVEIARGPQSAVYGTAAMGGAVQILTRAGEAGPTKSELTLEGARTNGRGDGRRGTFEAGGGSDLLRWSAGLGAAYDRGIYAVANDLHARDASLRLDYTPTATLALTGIGRFMGAESVLPVRDAGATRAPLDPNQRQGRDRTVGSLEATWAPSARWTHRLTVADYHLVFTFDDTKDAIVASQYPFFIRNFTYHSRSVLERTTARYVGTVSGDRAGSSGLALSYGAEWENESLNTSADGDFGPSQQTMSRPSYAAFAEGQLRAGDRWSFLAGARAQSFRGVGSALVPRATTVVSLVPHRVALRAGVAGAYNAPNIQVQFTDPAFLQGNPDLKSETSTSYELGVDVTGDRASLSATAFSQTYDNLIRVVPFNAQKQIAKNIGRTRASGIELEGRIAPRPQWIMGAQGAWTTTEVVDNSGLVTDIFPNGDPLPFRPTYTASGYTTYFARSGASATLRLMAVGPQTALAGRFRGPRVGVDAYSTVGATATCPVSPSLDVYLHAENVLNSGYAIEYDKPGSPRSVAIGVRARLTGPAK
jgi:outer membrane cobalamin receptor